MARSDPGISGDGPLPNGTYGGQSYYEQPPLKPSPWDWTVSGYIFLAGLSGAAQALALVALWLNPRGYRGAIRNARLFATVGSAIGAVLLIVDLRTPQRWYNMLRIYRQTSPMSFGTYILTDFGILSGLTAFGELLRGRGRTGRAAEKVADVAQVGAAAAGAGAATYTASLLSATSTPYWAAIPRQLAVQFASSAFASAAAALSLAERLAGRNRTSERLDDVAALASAVQLGASLGAEAQLRAKGVSEGLEDSRERQAAQIGELLIAGAVPLAAYLINRAAGARSPGLSILGSVSLLAGGFLVRHAVMKAGMESARRQKSYFRFAQPENLPELRESPPSQPRLTDA